MLWAEEEKCTSFDCPRRLETWIRASLRAAKSLASKHKVTKKHATLIVDNSSSP